MSGRDRRAEIMDILLDKRHCSLRGLANFFKVSYRTIIRDITYLSLTVPVYTTIGRYGGVYIPDEYTARRACAVYGAF